jgi:hypothetical protein
MGEKQDGGRVDDICQCPYRAAVDIFTSTFKRISNGRTLTL